MIKTIQLSKCKDKKNVIDISVKNNPEHVLAPTWDIVKDFKNNKISWKKYKKKYIKLLDKRYITRKDEFIELIKLGKKKVIYLACFCKDPKICHRTLAKAYLIEKKEQLNTLSEYAKNVRNGRECKGQQYLLDYLKGKKLTYKQAVLANCYGCLAFDADGRMSCESIICPLFPFMPWRKR